MEQDKNKSNDIFGGVRRAGRAVSDFLRAGRRNEARRARAEEREPATDEDFTDTAIEDRIRRTTVGGRRAQQKAVDDFWRSAYKRADGPTPPEARDTDNAIDLDSRIMEMSDEEFDNAVKTGALTPEQIRKAGEYAWDVYMGDVWSESHYADEGPEPTYDEFMADPEKYGYIRGGYEERDRAFDRYAKYGSKRK